MSSDAGVRAIQVVYWELRSQIETELRELTEAQVRVDGFLHAPTHAGRESVLLDARSRVTTLIRTNEAVLRLLYDLAADVDTATTEES